MFFLFPKSLLRTIPDFQKKKKKKSQMFRAEHSRIYWFRAEGAALSFLWPALEIWHYTAVQERTPVAGGRGPFPGKKHSKYWRCFPLWLRPELQDESINTVWLLWPLPAPTINWCLKFHLREPVKHVKSRGKGSFKPWKAWWLSFFFILSLSLSFLQGSCYQDVLSSLPERDILFP